MDKKIIIGIVAGVVALGIIITAIIGISTDFTFKPKNAASEQGSNASSSSQSGSSSSSGSTSSSSSEVVIKKGNLSLPTVKAEKGKNISIPIEIEKNP